MSDPVIKAFGTLLGILAYKQVPDSVINAVVDAVEEYTKWENDNDK